MKTTLRILILLLVPGLHAVLIPSCLRGRDAKTTASTPAEVRHKEKTEDSSPPPGNTGARDVQLRTTLHVDPAPSPPHQHNPAIPPEPTPRQPVSPPRQPEQVAPARIEEPLPAEPEASREPVPSPEIADQPSPPDPPVEITEARPDPPQPERQEPAAPEPGTDVPDAPFTSMRDRAIAAFRDAEGEVIPPLLIRIENPNRHRQALAHFSFQLIARSRHHRDVYFERDAQGRVHTRHGECPYGGWSLEPLPGDVSWFHRAARARNISLSDLDVFYKSMDGDHEAWLKGTALLAVREAGLTYDQAASVQGRFVPEGSGFRLVIEKIERRAP